MEKTLPFTGSGVAIITPFDGDKTNFDELGRIIDDQIAAGTDAIIICGTTGEASTMPDSEHLDVIKYAVKTAGGRVPVIAGTGSNDTAHAVMLSKKAEELGADGLLQVTPYYNKTSQRGLAAHFKAVAEAVSIPIILYNVPSRTGINISIPTLKELAEVENIVGIKEASGNLSYTVQVAAEVPELYIYSGNDDIIVPVLSIGGKGVISVLANVCPKETHEMCDAYLRGDTERARELQLKDTDLIGALFSDVNPIPVKTAMNLIGYNAGNLRMPLCNMSEEGLKTLKAALQNVGFEIKD